MASRPRILALGGSIAALAIGIMQPSAILTVPLLLVAVFLIAWAIIPDQIRHMAGRTGRFAPHIQHSLDGFDRLLSKITQEAESLDKQRQDKQQRFFSFKASLGDCLTAGRMLYSVNRRQLGNIDIRSALGHWRAQACQLIYDGMGSGEPEIFMNNEGIPLLFGSEDKIDVEVERRSTRICELMARLTPEIISSNFDAKKWSGAFDARSLFGGNR